MFDTYITVIGNVVDDPTRRQTANGRAVANFRLASTARQRDPDTGQYIDGDKFFVNVVCWRDLADNVAGSLRKGDPVVVRGRIATREYTKNEQLRASYEVTAEAVGPNLARGTCRFTKAGRSFAPTSVALDAEGLPPSLPPVGVSVPDSPAELTSAELVGTGSGR